MDGARALFRFVIGEDILFETSNDVVGEHEIFFLLLLFIKKDHSLERTFSDDNRDRDSISFFPPRFLLTEVKQPKTYSTKYLQGQNIYILEGKS